MSSKHRYWIVCNYTGCEHAAVLCFLGRAWLVDYPVRNSPCRQTRKRNFFVCSAPKEMMLSRHSPYTSVESSGCLRASTRQSSASSDVHGSLLRTEKASALSERFQDAGSRGRTDTRFKSNGILSPARLPIPPCRHEQS